MVPTQVWEGRSLGARALRTLLYPLSLLYAAGWRLYLLVYRWGLKRPVEAHRPVVCVGNLATGGSGKTPLTVHLAERIAASGRKVVVGCSGYGGPHESGATLAPAGPLRASEWGDEPALLRELLPAVPLVVGRARVEAARRVAEAHPDAVLLMDDGFQHLPLVKHVQIVLQSNSPNTMCLPAGPLREPPNALRRADLVLPGTFGVVADPLVLESPQGGRVEVADSASVLCAIGRPDSFCDALRAMGLTLDPILVLPDHDPLTEGNLLERLPSDQPVVVTAKDWVKLRERSDAGERRWLVARHRVRLEPADAFAAWLDRKLDEVESLSKEA